MVKKGSGKISYQIVDSREIIIKLSELSVAIIKRKISGLATRDWHIQQMRAAK